MTRIFKMKEQFENNSTSTKFLQEPRISSHPINETIVCKICEYTFSKIHNFLKQKYGLSWAIRVVTWLCSWELKYEVCKGSIDLWKNTVVDAVIEHYLDHEYICSSRFVCQFSHYVELDPDDFARKLLEDKPNNTQIEEFHKKNEKASNKTYKVLHITDLHTDFIYEEGSWGACGDFVCCRNYNGKSPTKQEAAGRWGFVGHCDLPIITVYNFLEHIKNDIKPDIILWTGDSNSHSVWNSTQQETINVVTFLCTLMKDKFNFTMPIYPAIGNHEFFPADEFNPYNRTDNEVVFNLTGTLWKDWIGEEAHTKYLEFGFYTIYNKDLNLRVIAMNTMDCDTINFNLIINPTDPAGQVI
jgi:sphingomyelin phosphodiesterase